MTHETPSGLRCFRFCGVVVIDVFRRFRRYWRELRPLLLAPARSLPVHEVLGSG